MQIDAARGVLWPGNARCNIAGRDRSAGISRIRRCTLSSDKTFDGEHLWRRVSFSPEGETGQPTLIMSAYARLLGTAQPRGFCHWTPVADHDRGLFLLNLPQEATRLLGMMSFAPAAG